LQEKNAGAAKLFTTLLRSRDSRRFSGEVALYYDKFTNRHKNMVHFQ